jgi:hypothetical protein
MEPGRACVYVCKGRRGGGGGEEGGRAGRGGRERERWSKNTHVDIEMGITPMHGWGKTVA